MNPSEQRPETKPDGSEWKNRKLNKRKTWKLDAEIGRTLIKVIKDELYSFAGHGVCTPSIDVCCTEYSVLSTI